MLLPKWELPVTLLSASLPKMKKLLLTKGLIILYFLIQIKIFNDYINKIKEDSNYTFFAYSGFDSKTKKENLYIVKKKEVKVRKPMSLSRKGEEKVDTEDKRSISRGRTCDTLNKKEVSLLLEEMGVEYEGKLKVTGMCEMLREQLDTNGLLLYFYNITQ